MEKLTDNIEESYKINLIYDGKEIELEIESDFTSFIEKICNILDISSSELNLFTMNYNDDDGDNILISSNEDYKLFFQQVKENSVKELIIERNDSQKNLKKTFIDRSEPNNRILNSDSININNFNKNSNNNYFNDEEIKNKKDEEIPIENMIFYYRCSSCDVYPIVVVMYYCNKCNLYLCEKCEKIKKKHQHAFIKIETKDQLINIKEEENSKIEKERKEKERREKERKEKERKEMERRERERKEKERRENNNDGFYNSHHRDNYNRHHSNGIIMNNYPNNCDRRDDGMNHRSQNNFTYNIESHNYPNNNYGLNNHNCQQRNYYLNCQIPYNNHYGNNLIGNNSNNRPLLFFNYNN